jgi:hypothetical protein
MAAMRRPRFQFCLLTIFAVTAVMCWAALILTAWDDDPTPFVLFIVIAAMLSPFCTIIVCTVADLRRNGYRPPRFQFHLSSLFILTAAVALCCLIGPPIIRELFSDYDYLQVKRPISTATDTFEAP